MNALFDVHVELSKMTFAIKQALEPFSVNVICQWQEGTYLSVQIECREKRKQAIIDRLMHGVVQGPYDYRFNVSYPTTPVGEYDWTFVTAYPDMFHPRNTKGN